jgi:predicted methyltransferase
MVKMANDHHDIGARLATFDDVEAVAQYDGVWANFSLLHAPRADLPRHLAALHRALKPGGLLHLGMKTGTGEARDGLDRLYSYYSVAELHGKLANAGFTVTATSEGHERGLAGTDDPFVIIEAHA